MTQRPGNDGLVQTQHDELDRLLDALGPAEPPADFLEDVMRQVKATTPAAVVRTNTSGAQPPNPCMSPRNANNGGVARRASHETSAATTITTAKAPARRWEYNPMAYFPSGLSTDGIASRPGR